jgi:beta-aspartyl-peptidase (threonine type)
VHTGGEPEQKHGTVGAVALDASGLLAAASSTGGILNKYPGRVGDTPLVGCGFYADDNAAISCTGHGEDFMRLMVAKRAADFVARGASARDAAEATIALISAKAQGTGGLIIVDRLGNVGFSWNSQHMARAYMCQDMQEPIAGV